MIFTPRLMVISALVLLGSVQSAAAECSIGSAPGRHGGETCYYRFTITKVEDAAAGRVKGKVSDDTLQQVKKDNPLFDLNAYANDERTFLIEDFSSQKIKAGDTCDFVSIPNTFYVKKQKC
jgi:hypothetical protein